MRARGHLPPGGTCHDTPDARALGNTDDGSNRSSVPTVYEFDRRHRMYLKGLHVIRQGVQWDAAELEARMACSWSTVRQIYSCCLSSRIPVSNNPHRHRAKAQRPRLRDAPDREVGRRDGHARAHPARPRLRHVLRLLSARFLFRFCPRRDIPIFISVPSSACESHYMLIHTSMCDSHYISGRTCCRRVGPVVFRF